MMVAMSQDPGAYPDSHYAAERRRIDRGRTFSPEFESEFIAARLLKDRTLIRASAVLALLIACSRFAIQGASGLAHGALLAELCAAEVASLALLWLTWSRGFERSYLRWAEIIVPVRNATAAAHFAAAAALGQVELLMVLPLLIIGPFFFAGLRYRAALASGVMTAAAFASISAFAMPGPVAARCALNLLIALAGSAIVARHFEKDARAGFLERYLIQELAQRDALTGACNRRSFDEHLPRIWHEAAQARRAIAVILIDVDHFKAYNDRYGHLAGDDALRAVARAVQAFIHQPGDILARYGGEEFAAVLQGVSAAQARLVAESMRRAVVALGIEHRGSRTCDSVTISLGVAAIEPSLARDCRGALQLADQALYRAKLNGRNGAELLDEAEYGLLTTGVFRSGGPNTMVDGEAPPQHSAVGSWRRAV